MKAPKEIKRWINQRRSREGKPNGVVSWLFDAPDVNLMMAKNKRLNLRTKAKDETYNLQKIGL